METEIEAKFPDIEPEALRTKLREIGAVQEYPEVFMKRKVELSRRRNNYRYMAVGSTFC